jgi:hypothetical protein
MNGMEIIYHFVNSMPSVYSLSGLSSTVWGGVEIVLIDHVSPVSVILLEITTDRII